MDLSRPFGLVSKYIESKKKFLAYIRLLAILRRGRRADKMAEALEEVFSCLDTHSQAQRDGEGWMWKYVDKAKDLAQLKWSSRVWVKYKPVEIWLSCLNPSVWKYISMERVDDNDPRHGICPKIYTAGFSG